jgi:hypothetical protein
MAIQQRSKILGSVQRRNERYLVLDVKDIITELNSAGEEGGIGGSAYVYVKANKSPVENAIELKRQYDLAKTMPVQTNTYNYAVSSVVENAGVYTVLFTNPSHLYNFNFGANNVVINNVSYTINVTEVNSSFGLQFTGLPSGLSFTSISLSLTTTVKISLVLAPGEYDFEEQTFVIDDNYVNVVSLTGNTDVKFIGFTPMTPDALHINANNILVKGIDVVEGAIKVGASLSNLVVEKCSGGHHSFNPILASPFQTLSGTFNDCTGGSYSFGGSSSALFMSGTFNNCVGGFFSFSPPQGYLMGMFNNCVGNDFSFSPQNGYLNGTFNNCVGKEYSFNPQSGYTSGTLNNCKASSTSFNGYQFSGVYNNCSARSYSFGATSASGSYIGCTAEDYSFRGSQMYGVYRNCSGFYNCFTTVYNYQSMSGSFYNCVAGNESFGASNYASVFSNFRDCQGGHKSFAGGIETTFEGTAINCSAYYGSFGGNFSSTIPTRILGRVINCQILGDNFLASAYFGPNGKLAGCFDNTGFIASRTA